MARYFFHLHDGQDLPDHVGQELPDMAAAQAHAAHVMILQLKEDLSSGLEPQPWTVDVRDEQGRRLFIIQFQSYRPT